MQLFVPVSIDANIHEMESLKVFLQGMINRRFVGGLRYGIPARRKRYLTRLSKELRAYRKTGNLEQLLNIALYAWLESYAPENKNFHWDPTVDSVTRDEMGV